MPTASCPISSRVPRISTARGSRVVHGHEALRYSTFSRNSASSSGGISNFGTKVTVVRSTFAGNSAAFFGDSILQKPSTPAATLRNTILASAGANCVVPPGGPITDGGYNIDNGTSCGFSAANNSKPSTDPKLDPNGLQDNGGLTETIALQEGSPAIDQGKSFGTNRDQRGESRPHDFAEIDNATDGDGSDIGALEVQP